MYRSLMSSPGWLGILIIVAGISGDGFAFNLGVKSHIAFAAEQNVAPQPKPPHLISFHQPDTDEASDPRDRPRGGGSRRVCQPETEDSPARCVEQQLMALVPSNQAADNENSAWGQTLEEEPTLWFYVPYSTQAIHQVVFELFDSDGNEIAINNSLDPSGASGIIGYRPSLAKGLEVNKTYRWHLLLRLDPTNPSGDAYISGRIKRIAMSPHIEQRLRTQDTLQIARALAAAGVWYDTLTTLTALHTQQPRYWQSLLQSVGLGNLSQEPISLAAP